MLTKCISQDSPKKLNQLFGCICVYVCVCVKRERKREVESREKTYYVEVTHGMRDVNKSLDLQWEVGTHKSPWCNFSPMVCLLETRKSRYFCSSPKAGKKKKMMLKLEVKWKEFHLPPPAFLFYLTVRWVPSTLRKSVCLTRFSNSNIYLVQNHPQGHI